MSKRKPCDYCLVCSREACEPRTSNPAPAPAPAPAPVPIPAPIPVPSPSPTPNPPPSTTKLGDIVTQELWDTVFPYADLSAVYSPKDSKPFWTRDYFLQAIDWLNNHKNPAFHGFGTSSNDPLINKLEVAAFLANTHQEVGDPSLKAPYPWLYPPADPQTGPHVGPAGGCVSLIEGLAPQVLVHDKGTPSPVKGVMNVTLENMRPTCRKVLGLRDNDVMSCVITSVKGAHQPGFGLGVGTGAVSFLPTLAAVSDDGTLYGNEPVNDSDGVVPSSKLVASTTDRRYACLGTYCQYGGRGGIQLSYSYNVSWCSMDLFGDYRLVRYPNLLITADRENWNGIPECFGFPGSNEGGKNALPANIATTTPPAQIMAWASCIWFWMTLRSARPISCHQAMMEPKKYGITAVNLIVNNQSGLTPSWAADKLVYYKRICNIMGIPWEGTIVSPPGIK